MKFFIPLLAGCAAGVLAAWGVGGGTLLLLAMTLLLGVPQRTAQAINLLFFLPTAAVALLYHRKGGYLRPEILRRTIPVGSLCAALAALLAQHIDTEALRRPFGVFLLLAGVMLLLQSRKKHSGGTEEHDTPS
ncbi:MAG: TSUP family transporter [Oscillospiraceae bacterium]